MKLDLSLAPSGSFSRDAQLIRRAEHLGMDAVWTAETDHNPFFSLTLAAANTRSIKLGTQAAYAFPRSPMVTAQIAWDLARQSCGRFILGLGTEPRARLKSNSGAARDIPVARMREYIESLRAIWDSFQTDARLRFRGEHYQFRLMAPFFNPGPIAHPNIPIYLTAENPAFCELAGEICQGIHVQPLHSADQLRQTVLPAISAGLRASRRLRSGFIVTAAVLVVTGVTGEARRRSLRRTRRHIAVLAGGPSSQCLIKRPGWANLTEELSEMAGRGHWRQMPALISDDIVHEIAVVGEPDAVLHQIASRYEGLANRVSLVLSEPDDDAIEAILLARRQAS